MEEKILFWDIEMAPGVYYGWSQYDPPIHQKEHSTISCIAYKWAHEDKVHVIHLNKFQYTSNPRNEKIIIKKFMEVMNQADIAVAHNGDKFDWKKLNARVVKYFNGAPLKKPLLIDTLKLARSEFKFDSNRLGSLAEYLNLSNKIETSKNLFIKYLNRDWDAVQELVKYCAGDVKTLEEIYNVLKPHVKAPYNKNIFNEEGQIGCVSCGSTNLKKFGTYITSTGINQRHRCNDCGSTRTCETKNGKLRGV